MITDVDSVGPTRAHDQLFSDGQVDPNEMNDHHESEPTPSTASRFKKRKLTVKSNSKPIKPVSARTRAKAQVADVSHEAGKPSC
jgi:hypothetical protein